MRLAIAIVCAWSSLARAGVDDDVDGAAAWCDGTQVAYDEGAIVGSGERVDVRHAAIGCRGAVTWMFVTGSGWEGARVIAVSPTPDQLGAVARRADAIAQEPSCGAGADPTDVAIALAAPGTEIRMRCAAWRDRHVVELARALVTALASPAARKAMLENNARSEFPDDELVLDDGELTPRF